MVALPEVEGLRAEWPQSFQPHVVDARKGRSELARARIGRRTLLERRLAVHAVPVPDVELCRRIVEAVDGLPLGIELAAARLRTADAEELLRQLARSASAVDTRPQRGTGAQHHSLSEMIASSLDLLDRNVEFDALFAVTDVIAIDAMHALEDAGLSVPGDVAVVGFDDILLAAHVSPPLTTVRQDIRLAAEGLVEGIVGLIEGEPVESSVMAPKLVVRASCGAQ